MNRIDLKFEELKLARRAALMPYLPLGFPTMDVSRRLIRTAAEAGADVLELGVPFSDPLADGPVIQHATHIALRNGVTLGQCIRMVREAREDGVTIPLVLMSYYNPILRFGMDGFTRAAQQAGVDGLIVPDLPLEEAGPLGAECRAHGLGLILLAAPTTADERLRTIAEATRGFLYLVSLVGVTGARDRVSQGLQEFVQRVRAVTSKPACVGFGIANAETAQAVAQCADGVIVGSALVSRIGLPESAVNAAQEFIQELRMAIEG